MEIAHIVTDLGFGDAGKGTTVDYLARQVDSAVVVRHSGGAQAAHNVVTPDGRHHTFAQFGSGSFVEGAKTHLSRFMMVSPGTMFSEAEHLIGLGVADIWSRLTVDAQAPLVLPWHRAANRLRELERGAGRHGSCGVGISELQIDLLEDASAVLRVGDLLGSPDVLARRLLELQRRKAEQLNHLAWLPGEQADDAWRILTNDDLPEGMVRRYAQWLKTGLRVVDGGYLQDLSDGHEAVIFEGSQGVLLDEWYGFHPYTTWSTTTSENALTLLGELDHAAPVNRIGVLRAYTTRHGPGPFVTERPELANQIPELHNGLGTWMGAFRYGDLDLVGTRYAIEATRGVDQLSVTGLDRSDAWRFVDAYEPSPEALAEPSFFQWADDGLIDGIRLGIQGDLDYQQRLGELLQSCRPAFHDPGTVDGRELLSVIEETLGSPVTIASYGPSAADKRVPVAS